MCDEYIGTMGLRALFPKSVFMSFGRLFTIINFPAGDI